jgi:hypothetical protein
MKVAPKNNIDSPDPHESMGAIYNTSLLSKLNKLVMEMCKQLFGSKRTVNMDNFYTPPCSFVRPPEPEIVFLRDCLEELLHGICKHYLYQD